VLAGSLTIIAGQPSGNLSDLMENQASGRTLVFLMGVQNLPVIVQALLGRGLPPETLIALIEQGTTPSQKVVTGCLEILWI
jgi:siroheme synthase